MKNIFDLQTEPQRRPKTALNHKQEMHIYNKRAFNLSLGPYRSGTSDCDRICSFLLSSLKPVKIGYKTGSKSYKHYRYWTDGIQHYAIKKWADQKNLIRFSVYHCAEDGHLLLPQKYGKKRAADLHLSAPDLWAMRNGEKVPLNSSQRGQWKKDLEARALGYDSKVTSHDVNVPLPSIADPSFIFEKGGPIWIDEHGLIQEDRMFWFWLKNCTGRQRGIRSSDANLLYQMARYFITAWYLSAGKSRRGLPCIIEAADAHLGKRLDVSPDRARAARLKLQRGKFLQRAYEYDSAIGNPHFGYLPGTGITPEMLNGTKTHDSQDEISYSRPGAVLRAYRMKYGVPHDYEIRIMKEHERKKELIVNFGECI